MRMTTTSTFLEKKQKKNQKIKMNQAVSANFVLVFFVSSELWRHLRSCPQKIQFDGCDETASHHSDLIIFGSKKTPLPASVEFNHLLEKLRSEEIGNFVRNDGLLVRYGESLMYRKGAEKPQNILQNLRLIARLAISMNSTCKSNSSCLDLFIPSNFDLIIETTRELAGYKATNDDGELLPTYSVASLPLKMGYALDAIFSLILGIGLRESNDTIIMNARNLASLYTSEWPVKMSSAALRTLADNRFNKINVLPTTEDLLMVHKYRCSQNSCSQIAQSIIGESWQKP
uniref:Uncharacterized protein n=1 Tax=Clytia hemisphaerica TaxID=252671 RepID=A0A7M5V6H5_9CNID